MNGDPLWASSDMKGETEKLDNDIKSAISKIQSGDLDQSIMNQIGEEADKQATSREKLQK